MSRNDVFLRKASVVARQSTHYFRVGAVIQKHGRVLSVGHNRINRHNSRRGVKWIHSIHAEESAISKLSNAQLKGATIYVARLLKSGKTALAKPCPCCMDLINSCGISKVFYTTH